jgi:hypothetical protein
MAGSNIEPRRRSNKPFRNGGPMALSPRPLAYRQPVECSSAVVGPTMGTNNSQHRNTHTHTHSLTHSHTTVERVE